MVGLMAAVKVVRLVGLRVGLMDVCLVVSWAAMRVDSMVASMVAYLVAKWVE